MNHIFCACLSPRTTDAQWSLFSLKSQTFRQTIWTDKFWTIWGYSLINYFYKYEKTKPLYPNPKYIFGIGIWIWAAKNLKFSLRVSVVCDWLQAEHAVIILLKFVSIHQQRLEKDEMSVMKASRKCTFFDHFCSTWGMMSWGSDTS